MTGQTMMIIVIALGAGAFAAGCAWLGFDLLEILGERRAVRREQKRMLAEAAALKAAQEAANEKD